MIDIKGQLTTLANRPPAPYITAKITNPQTGVGQSFRILLDTGSTTTVLPIEYYESLGFNISTMPKTERPTGVGRVTVYTGKVVIEVGEDKSEIDADFALGWTIPLLGYSFLQHCKMQVDYPNQAFSLSKP